MAFFGRKTQLRVNPRHSQTTPVFDRTTKSGFWSGLVKFLSLPVGIGAALLYFGEPALRVQYIYSGSLSSPTYHDCTYRSLLNWHEVRPLDGECPVVVFLPVKFTKLIGGSK